jgi:hypothetical protein
MIVTSEYILNKIAPPSLPTPPGEYDPRYVEQFNNVLRLYFNRLNGLLGQLNTGAGPIDGSALQFPSGAFHQDGATTLTGTMSNVSVTPIQVVSTAQFEPTGTLLIANELIAYTGKTSTEFTGITRGIYGTTNTSHGISANVTEAQGTASSTSSTALLLDTTDFSNGVSIDTTTISRVNFAVGGYYNVQFSAQLLNYTTSEDNVTFWWKQNGVDVPYSAGIQQVNSKHGSSPGANIVSWNTVLPVTAGDYLQLYYASDTGNTVVATYPAGVAPGIVHPVSPALILTATFVSALTPA